MKVLFLCPHAAAKSLVAKCLFEREAKAVGLAVEIDSAGTDPDPEPMPEVVALLAGEGIDASKHVPRKVSEADLASATRVISLGCALDELPARVTITDDWSDVPLPSQDLEGMRRIVGARVRELARALSEDS